MTAGPTGKSLKLELAALVKRSRQAASLSMSKAAEMSGISKGTVSAFEAGKSLLDRNNFIKYIDTCKITGSDRVRAVKLYNQAQRSHMTG